MLGLRRTIRAHRTWKRIERQMRRESKLKRNSKNYKRCILETKFYLEGRYNEIDKLVERYSDCILLSGNEIERLYAFVEHVKLEMDLIISDLGEGATLHNHCGIRESFRLIEEYKNKLRSVEYITREDVLQILKFIREGFDNELRVLKILEWRTL